MKTGIMAIQDQRIDGCKKNRAARACFCGRFKWVGYDFCWYEFSECDTGETVLKGCLRHFINNMLNETVCGSD